MKNATLDIDYSDLHHGKYDSPMAQYIDIHLSELGFGDEDESDGMGQGMRRYGHRIYSWDDQGFQGCDTFTTVADAETVFATRSDWYYSECEKCGEKVHNDTDSWYEHEKYECSPILTCETCGESIQYDENLSKWVMTDGRTWKCNQVDDNDAREHHPASEPGGYLDELRQAENLLGTE